jgi:alpha-N-arabinofuranosidase
MRRLLPLLALLMVAASASAQPLRMIVGTEAGEHTINKHIYGHFAEHLGRGVYDGIWRQNEVGEWAIREDVVEALRRIQIPNLRWPGGCFADYYHWRDGLGSPADRPAIVNTLWGGVTEDNGVGTHEFMALVDALDTEPIVVGNVGSGTVEEMADWWEYMNHPGPSPMADLRAEHGRAEPWGVRFWGVGNESWGCGGNMDAAYYADLYKRFATYLHPYGGVRPFRIAAGPAGDDYAWTETLMREAGPMIDGIDVHHYTINGSWETQKGPAVEFNEAEWFELMQRALQTDDIVRGHAAVLDRYDPDGRVWLIVGEWGTWHQPAPGTNPGFLYQQNTLRDAIVAALSLNIFNAHADRVKMANIAQTVNVLQAMILTREDEMILTPTYHVFDFYTVHHDATLLPLTLDRGTYTFEGESIPAVSASASRDAEGRVHLTLANLDPHHEHPIVASIRGLDATSVSGRILTADAMNAHNTFETPETIVPASFDGAHLSGEDLTIDLPAKSVVVLTLE